MTEPLTAPLELSELPGRDAIAERVAASALDAAGRRSAAFPWSAGPALAPETAATPLGDIEAMLRTGPTDARSVRLVSGLIALGSAARLATDADETVARLAWLAANTPFDALGSLDRELGADAAPAWQALARLLAAPGASGLGRAETVVAAAALGGCARGVAGDIAATLDDPTLRRLLSAPLPMDALEGELVAPPRSTFATIVMALTGLLFVVAAGRWLGRLALGVRRPASLSVTHRGVEISHRVELLGRVVRERKNLVPFASLASVTREVRFARAGLYAGLIALALGSYLGAGLFVDGVRVPGTSPPLLGLALLVLAAGVVLDFGLTALSDTSRGRCRIVVRPTRGAAHCVSAVDRDRADGPRMQQEWPKRLSGPRFPKAS